MYKKILLIDDDADEQFFFSEALQEIDTSVQFFFALGGLRGLAMAKSLKPDYIFLDINMPMIDGMKCLENIVSDNADANSKVIMYSTGLTNDICETALKKGAWDCIKKHNSVGSLISTLKKIIR